MDHETLNSGKMKSSDQHPVKTKDMTFYYPSPDSFPSISITGHACSLNCAHCRREYLRGMIPVKPKNLLELCREMEAKGALGCLISGGCNPDGSVSLPPEQIKEVKDNTDMIICVHTGFIDRKKALGFVKAGVDYTCFDFVGDSRTARNVYGLNRAPKEYEKSMAEMIDAGLKVSPHVCIGLDFGRLGHEEKAFEIISNHEISSLVLLILLPTKGTPMEHAEVSTPDALRTIKLAREMMPDKKIKLGCMRPRIIDVEQSVDYFDGVANPSPICEKAAHEKNLKITKKRTCCVVE